MIRREGSAVGSNVGSGGAGSSGDIFHKFHRAGSGAG